MGGVVFTRVSLEKATGWGSPLKGEAPCFQRRHIRASFQCCLHRPPHSYSLRSPAQLHISLNNRVSSAPQTHSGTEDGTRLGRAVFGRNGRFSVVSVKGQSWLYEEDEDTKSKFNLSQNTWWICHLVEQQQQKPSGIECSMEKKNLRTL